ncbi:MAG: hypothetical protein KJ947_17265 [Alphaproteobacteria bacterium]|nr:hypothetical protein [Alphaproteobacteria bacterium]MBU1551310.1 hypothetical protein [Alphaproteobacteria bacterium]MBU2334755.1 hypothetical protein [Alphaproteobacteria bacterium]MBU2389258.1 hypothetical protein [Alphaproteobacteria bacterium]
MISRLTCRPWRPENSDVCEMPEVSGPISFQNLVDRVTPWAGIGQTQSTGAFELARPQWEKFERWHELFDGLCAEQGHFDNARLASIFCTVTRNNGQANYDAALKNLANWRRGVHIPSRKNFLALSKVIDLEGDDGLMDRWNRLYGEARKPAGEDSAEPTTPPVANNDDRKIRSVIYSTRWVSGATMVMVLAVVGAGAYLLHSGYYISAEGIRAIDVEYRRSVSLRVGESSVIHGARSDCGERAPNWEITQSRLPALPIGTWSDGGEGKRYSRACGGPTPARGVVFTATQPGLEQFLLYGDSVTIHVE